MPMIVLLDQMQQRRARRLSRHLLFLIRLREMLAAISAQMGHRVTSLVRVQVCASSDSRWSDPSG